MYRKTLKILFSIWALSFLISQYYCFFKYDHSSTQCSTSRCGAVSLKPWPTLPSYVPWLPDPNLSVNLSAVHACEAYFGNGFTRRLELLEESSSLKSEENSWFRCFYGERLGSSVCEGGGIRMIPEKIKMSRGGEKMETVIGREEEEELPIFVDGAFEIGLSSGYGSRVGKKLVEEEFLDKYVNVEGDGRHPVRDLIYSIRLVDVAKFTNCSQWVEEPTVFVTRFEYANLYHTVTELYNAYVSSRVTSFPNRPHLVFLDGHCEGLSRDINCHGILPSPDHDLSKLPEDEKTARLSEFGEMIRASFGFQSNHQQQERAQSGRHNILFVRREDYLSHPRKKGTIVSRISNEQEVFDYIKDWATGSTLSGCEVNVVNGFFGHMTMREQIEAVKDAAVIVGAHGAGLTHIVSAMPGTVVLEILASDFMRPHYELIAKWRRLDYHSIHIDGSHYTDPQLVIDKLSSILTSIGC